ncbi:MAG: HlyD family type I secretion periplasmic adaptor subunit [Proteobacteria bacterium]|nr:HlyD family type I secretion periplasmic adaptor subunit [Pseudomonadota bacterium]
MALNTKRSLNRIILTGYVSVFVMAGVLTAWSMTADLNGAVIAPATIIVETYSKRVQHRDGGTIRSILVKDGDRVVEGQDLILLDPTESRAELGIVASALDELMVRKARLESERDGVASLTLPAELRGREAEAGLSEIISGQSKLLQSNAESDRGKTEQLAQQVSQLREQINGIDGQSSSIKTQISLIDQELDNLKKLQAKGLVPSSRILSTEREQARLLGEEANLVSSRAAAEARIGEVKLRTIQIQDDRRTQALSDLRDTEAKIAELRERRVATSARLDRTSIKAPITGTVYQLMVHTEGGVIGSGDTLMLIVPEGDDLVLQAQVLPKDIDEVAPGQHALVRFPSFNARVTPEVNAEVTQVAADVSQRDAQSPPFYSVRITIPAKELERLKEHKLKPGMQAEAFIQTSARSPLSYLVKPLLDQLSHAMRES